MLDVATRNKRMDTVGRIQLREDFFDGQSAKSIALR
jgi:hypothetical protein